MKPSFMILLLPLTNKRWLPILEICYARPRLAAWRLAACSSNAGVCQMFVKCQMFVSLKFVVCQMFVSLKFVVCQMFVSLKFVVCQMFVSLNVRQTPEFVLFFWRSNQSEKRVCVSKGKFRLTSPAPNEGGGVWCEGQFGSHWNKKGVILTHNVESLVELNFDPELRVIGEYLS